MLFLGNTTLEVLYLAGKFCLVKTFINTCPVPHTAEAYTGWIKKSVKNEFFLFLNQLIFGCLESYFIFKVTQYLLFLGHPPNLIMVMVLVCMVNP